jgi:ABC-type transporter Mla subunit MlaD
VRTAHHTQRLPNWALGLIAVVVIAFGSYLAYTKDLPWSKPFQVHAVFDSAQNMRKGSPVRVAGVNVGEVTGVELVGAPPSEPITQVGPSEQGSGVRVTMELSEEALPLAEDSVIKVRPRLFLDGNYFVDIFPGSPSAPEIEDGHTFGLDRTAHSVQLDQVLGVFDGDVRSDFQTLLDQLGNAFTKYDGAEGLRKLFRAAPASYRYGAEVSEAQLGTEQGDLRGMIRGLGKVLGGLSRNEQALRELVTNFRTVTGSFAAQDRALGRTIDVLPGFLAEGPPTFRRLNSAFPSLRAFAREALPGIRRSPEALRAQIPMLQELRGLMSRSELRGLVSRLRPTVPALAKLARGNVKLFSQQRAFSSCFNEVIIPWSHSTVEPVDPGGIYPLDVNGRTFEETPFGFTGSASESRIGDAQGQHLRVLGGSGSNLIRFDPVAGGRSDEVFGLTPFPVLGAIPRINDSAKTEYRPDVACETQEAPNLQAGIGAPPDQEPAPTAASGDLDLLSGPGVDKAREYVQALDDPSILKALPPGERKQEIEEIQNFVDALGLTQVDVEAFVEGDG